MIETECFGVDYERYSLGRCLERLVREYKLKNCVEIPALGAKAMPSIYSLGLAKAGADVTLVNPAASAKESWAKAGLLKSMDVSYQEDIHHTLFADNSFDWVWNFAYFGTDPDPAAFLQEMKRISRKYVAIFSVNGRNIGAYIHRTLHKLLKVPWTHGDVAFNFPKRLAGFVKDPELQLFKIGVVDCPFWPDSIGFRDMRLHRQTLERSDVGWQSNTLEWMSKGRYPAWIHLVYAFESIPVPLFIKYIYSHIFYIIWEKAA